MADITNPPRCNIILSRITRREALETMEFECGECGYTGQGTESHQDYAARIARERADYAARKLTVEV